MVYIVNYRYAYQKRSTGLLTLQRLLSSCCIFLYRQFQMYVSPLQASPALANTHAHSLTHVLRSKCYLWSAFLCQRLILPQPQPLVARSKWDIFIAAHYIFNLKIITIKKKLYKSNNVCPSLADTFCCCRCLCRYWCWCCHFRGAVVTTFLLIVVAEDAAVSEYWS